MTKERPKPRCKYLLCYLGRKLCREVWKRDMMAEAKLLDLGCPKDCSKYEAAYPTIWREDEPVEETGKGE